MVEHFIAAVRIAVSWPTRVPSFYSRVESVAVEAVAWRTMYPPLHAFSVE
jgi:hypothetical protein